MLLIKYQQQLITKYDLINKFVYKNLGEVPNLKKIAINLGCNKNLNLKNLAAALLSIELIAKQKGKLTSCSTAVTTTIINIRKGYPVGCKTTLQNLKMYNFILKLLLYVFPKIKNFYGIVMSKKNKKNTLTYRLKTPFIFPELEQHHNIFKNLPFLNISFVTTTKSQKELKFLLNSYKLPIT